MALFLRELRCLKCGRVFKPGKNLYVCRACGGKIEASYNYEEMELRKGDLEKRTPGVWKYKELLPAEKRVTLGEGGTPLLKANELGKELGLKNLYLKDETRNPTGSFKDRMMTVGVSKAVEFGAKAVVTASSGNAAISLAAYAANAGLFCYAFVPATAPESKIAQLSIHGAKVVKVAGKKKGDPTYEMMVEGWKKFGWQPIPSAGAFNPYHWEGIKTLSHEICESLGWDVPDWIFVPTGAGTLLSGTAKGFFEFQRFGFINGVPRIACVQAAGCAPLVNAFKKNIPPEKIETWPSPKTIAGGLIDPFPWDADTALPALNKTDGIAVAVSDREILEAEKLLARREGIFAEPSGAAGIAGLKKLLEDGSVDKSDVVVVEVTGGGLKDIKAAMKISEPPLTFRGKDLEKILAA
ncbi:MAG: threonine synthase [Candidatus Hadarchaeales archaeon]